MIDNNLVLYLPFDDPDGSVAYDFSKSRADATLSNGASFSKKAKIGKSISFNGDGECETSKAIAFGSDFTITCYVYPATKRIGWLLNLPGVDNYIEQWIDVVPGEWYFFAFVKQEALLPCIKTPAKYTKAHSLALLLDSQSMMIA